MAYVEAQTPRSGQPTGCNVVTLGDTRRQGLDEPGEEWAVGDADGQDCALDPDAEYNRKEQYKEQRRKG